MGAQGVSPSFAYSQCTGLYLGSYKAFDVLKHRHAENEEYYRQKVSKYYRQSVSDRMVSCVTLLMYLRTTTCAGRTSARPTSSAAACRGRTTRVDCTRCSTSSARHLLRGHLRGRLPRGRLLPRLPREPLLQQFSSEGCRLEQAR